ncbi:hypothetical protein ACU4GD_39715 [Cupriavidus basilensis]
MKALSELERVKLHTLPCLDHSLFLPESRQAFARVPGPARHAARSRTGGRHRGDG